MIKLMNDKKQNQDEKKIRKIKNEKEKLKNKINDVSTEEEENEYEKEEKVEDVKKENKDDKKKLIYQKFFMESLLEELDLSYNSIVKFPKFIFYLFKLKILNLSKNNLTNLPFELFLMPSLSELNLSYNKLIDLKMTQCKASSHFKIKSTLDHKPASKKSKEKHPNFSNSSIFSPVFNIIDKIKLEPNYYEVYNDKEDDFLFNLQARNNSLSTLSTPKDSPSKQLHFLSQLKVLDLSFNLLEEVPVGLACVACRLEKLNLSGNQITYFFPLNKYPFTLQVLDISRNKLVFDDGININKNSKISPFTYRRSSFNSDIFSYKSPSIVSKDSSETLLHPKGATFHIKKFSSSSSLSPPQEPQTPVVCLHTQHDQLYSLKTLILNNNFLSNFKFSSQTSFNSKQKFSKPRSFSENEKTQKKNYKIDNINRKTLNNSKIKLFFPNLLSLDLSFNLLEGLPKQTSLLSCLCSLNISNNKIKELPCEIGSLKKLWSLNLTNNPIEETLKSVLGQKFKLVSSIVLYLRALRDEAVPYRHMRLLIVGNQHVGKTCLFNILTKEKKLQNKSGKTCLKEGHKNLKYCSFGVRISDILLKRQDEEVSLNVWDFSGKKDQGTHQYFMSKRCIYILVWKMTDGEEGLNSLFMWLINIQAKAPGSSVVIVGTHLDLIQKTHPQQHIDQLLSLLETKYINLEEPEKLGFPRVVGHLELSCKPISSGSTFFPTNLTSSPLSKYYSLLIDFIWKGVNTMVDRQNMRLLDQKVPVNFIYLQKVVQSLSREKKEKHEEPILNANQFKQAVIEKMEEKYGTSFHDIHELNQATSFLHENGILLHYEDSKLKDFYFLDPLWLCEILNCIVTAKEINKSPLNGVMKVKDLSFFFKDLNTRLLLLKDIIINLLHKFEVALQWDRSHLLIPYLLPADSRGKPLQFVMIPALCSNLKPVQSFSSITSKPFKSPLPREINNPMIKRIPNPSLSYFRLYAMSYFPSGFWSRLITRMLGDPHYHQYLRSYYDFSLLNDSEVDVENLPGSYWHCWQTGLELQHMSLPILRIKELSPFVSEGVFDYSSYELVSREEGNFHWSSVKNMDGSVLEIIVFNESFSLKPSSQSQPLTIYPNCHTAVKFLTMAIEQIDTLLEDWYPSLGTRFTKDIKGSMLINRLVPCTHCLLLHQKKIKEEVEETQKEEKQKNKTNSDSTKSFILNIASAVSSSFSPPISPNSILFNSYEQNQPTSDPRSPPEKTRVRSQTPLRFASHSDAPKNTVYSFYVEHCIRSSQASKIISCPLHGNLGPYFLASSSGFIQPYHIAPDTVFYDIDPRFQVPEECLQRKRFLGKGAFGAVYSGVLTNMSTNKKEQVALKLFRPILPQEDLPMEIVKQIKRDISLWNKDPSQSFCEAYTIARKELSILLNLQHPNIVRLLGVCSSPLSILLSLAPLGALNDHFKKFNRYNLKLPLFTIRDVILQVSSALKYLHSNQIIYRDLKSENILVWFFPDCQNIEENSEIIWPMVPLTQPFYSSSPSKILVKLADYGVSRVILPTGTKGLAGTLPYMAPEIIFQNGEEAYNEKIDCYSFSILIYELLTLKSPYETDAFLGSCKINLKGYVLSGGRPSLTLEETRYPINMLELMTWCWSHDPLLRPSASIIEYFGSHFDFCSLVTSWVASNNMVVKNCCCLGDETCVESSTDPSYDWPTFPGNYDLSFYGFVLYLEKPLSLTSSFSSLSLSSSKVKKSSSLYLCLYTPHFQLTFQQLEMDVAEITCLKVVKKTLFCGTSQSTVLIYSLTTFQKVNEYLITKTKIPISSISYLASSNQLCFLMDDAKVVFLSFYLISGFTQQISIIENLKYFSLQPPNSLFSDNYRQIVYCILFVENKNGDFLWCGQAEASIVVWEVDRDSASLRQVATLNHKNYSKPPIFFPQICDTVILTNQSSKSHNVFSYVYPGTHIFKWDSKSRVACQHINLQNYDFKNSSQIRNLLLLNKKLYITTSHGVVLCFSEDNLLPVFSSHCHSSIEFLLPLSSPYPSMPSYFVTIGKGYYSLKSKSLKKNENSDNHQISSDESKFHILTWATDPLIS